MFGPAMRGFVLPSVILVIPVFWGALACSRAADDTSSSTASPWATGAGTGSAAPPGLHVAPPVNVDLKLPPPDTVKTASGLLYKKLVASATGAQPRRNDTVMIKFTAWHQSTGEAFFSNRGDHGGPIAFNLAQAAPGFVEAMQLLRAGEQAMLWLPPSIGYKTPPADGKGDTLVYQVDVLEVLPAPAIPDDVARPPDGATALKSGTRFVVARPGTGKDAVRRFDTVTFNYTAWDLGGRMVDTTESRSSHAITSQVHRLSTGMIEMLTQMTVGERARFWIDAEKMTGSHAPPGVDHGTLCYEVEVTQVTKVEHEPPLPPPDVAKPPADARKTAKGVFYRVLASGPGKDPRHPTANDTVKVNYTGWTTDGKMFDSSILTGQPAQFMLRNVIAGWTDGIPVMMIGDRVRFWIPEELAYKGQPGKPQGMLVFEVELLEIVEPNPH
jgi:FKBP-type peptidyl-prolyl cis-trans isomerase